MSTMFDIVSSHSTSVNTRVSWDGDTAPGKDKPSKCSVTIPGSHKSMRDVMTKLHSMPGNTVLRVSGLKRSDGSFTLTASVTFSPAKLMDLLIAVAGRQTDSKGLPVVLFDPRNDGIGADESGKPDNDSGADMTEYSSNNANAELIALRDEAKSLGIEPGRKAINTLRKLIAEHKASQPTNGIPTASPA